MDRTPLVHSTASEGSASTVSQDQSGMSREVEHSTLRLRGGGGTVGGKRTREVLLETQSVPLSLRFSSCHGWMNAIDYYFRETCWETGWN